MVASGPRCDDQWMLLHYGTSWTRPDASWQVKAARALHHFRSLEAEVEAFRELEPYTLTPEPTPKPGRLAYRLRYVHPFPTSISAIVGDVLANLRAALEGSVALCVGKIEAELSNEVIGPLTAVAAAGVGVRWLPVPG